MGSFNTSCFVSKQTIASGDECQIVAICQQRTFEPAQVEHRGYIKQLHGVCNSTCYPTRFWKPVSSFLAATYDDYGRVTLKDTPLNRYRLFQFVRQALHHTPVVAQGDNPSHDVPCNLKVFMQEQTPGLLALMTSLEPKLLDADEAFKQCLACWNYLFEVAYEQRLFWEDHSGVLSCTGFAVMHQAAFDELLALTGSRVNYRGEPQGSRDIFGRALLDLEAALLKAAAMPGSSEVFGDKRIAYMMACDQFMDRLKSVGQFGGGDFYADHSIYRNALEAYQQDKLTADQLFERIEPWLAVRQACSALAELNLHFEPMVYAGQDYSNEIGAAFAAFVAKVSPKVSRLRAISGYGPLQTYVVWVGAKDDLSRLPNLAKGWDAHLEVLSTKAVYGHHGLVEAEMLSSASREDLLEFLQSEDSAMAGLLPGSLRILA